MVLTPMIIVLLILLNLCGVLCGYLVGTGKKLKPDGYFRVDTMNPDKDVFTLELTCPIGEIPAKEYVIFQVTNVSSQEKPFA